VCKEKFGSEQAVFSKSSRIFQRPLYLKGTDCDDGKWFCRLDVGIIIIESLIKVSVRLGVSKSFHHIP
jgi:hypothetical protein